MRLFCWTSYSATVGSISAVFSSPVFDPPSGVSAGSFPEQRLVIEPSTTAVTKVTETKLTNQITGYEQWKNYVKNREKET